MSIEGVRAFVRIRCGWGERCAIDSRCNGVQPVEDGAEARGGLRIGADRFEEALGFFGVGEGDGEEDGVGDFVGGIAPIGGAAAEGFDGGEESPGEGGDLVVGVDECFGDEGFGFGAE